jgi:iron(III) transport system permease protein
MKTEVRAPLSRRREGLDERVLFFGLAALLAVLSLMPIGRLLWEIIVQRGAVTLAPLRDTLSDTATWTATRNSLEVAIGGTLLALVVGTSVAIVVALTDMRCRNAFVFCFVLPLMIAPQVTALAWLQVTGPASPLLKLVGLAPPMGTRNPLYSREGIILVLGAQYAPLVFLTLRAGLRGLPRELIEAALAAGASGPTVLRTIVLPLMTPALIAGAALTFVSCIGNFGIPAFLGIPGGFIVLPTLIYQRLAGLGPSVLSEVAVLSTIVGLIAVAGIVLQDMMLRRRDYRITAAALSARPFALRAWRLPVEAGLWLLMAFVLVLPLIGLVLTSLIPAYGVPLSARTVTLANYAYVLFEHISARRAFANSIMLSMTAAALIAFFCVPLAYHVVWRRSRLMQLLNIAAELPYALPGVVLAIAAILLFLKPLPLLGVSLYNTIWIIFFAYLARFLVLGLKPVISGYHQLDRALEEAGQVAGARLTRRLRDLIAPLVAPAAAAGALLVFLTSFNELTVSALLWASGTETLGVIVFSFEQGGESNYAAAVATITVVLTFCLMLSTLLLARRLPPGVLPMARLEIRSVTRSFGPYRALDGVSLDVRDGELLAVLGPSGCGKTTLLRAIAGFDPIDSGCILIGGKEVSSAQVHVPPEQRRVGIVFQSYALWPHMTVAENVAYSLKVAGVSRAEREQRTKEALAVVGLGEFAERRPALLSGGQRQRVALARCLVMTPSIVLLDEPLANLDVHLRAAMENEFADFHERTGTTMIYITHDQAEAMALADRIVVLDRGRQQQVASPSELFREPANETVARFIGQGMILPARIGRRAADGMSDVVVHGLQCRMRSAPGQTAVEHGKVCLRPRDLRMARAGEAAIPCIVQRLVYQGGYFRLEALADGPHGAKLELEIGEPAGVELGQRIGVAVEGGWVIPSDGSEGR